MVELTRPNGFDVDILAEVPFGNHVRPAGDDIQKGAEILHPGTVIGPGHLRVLASLGRQTVNVYRRPRVGVMSTGDELVEGPEPLKPGQIRDSNRVMLLSLVEEAGMTQSILGWPPMMNWPSKPFSVKGPQPVMPSSPPAASAWETSTLSKAVLTRLGDFSWMQVAIKRRNRWCSGLLDEVPIFGLPGNPVSSLVSFELFARAGLRRMMGRLDAERPRVTATADEPFTSPSRRQNPLHQSARPS